MASNIHIISCRDFLRYDAGGDFDADTTRGALREIADQCICAGLRHAMLDVRDITDAPTIAQLFWIADELPALGFSRLDRLAIVYIDQGHGRATFFAKAAHNRGFNVREFTEFEGAFHWLSTAAPTGD